MSLVSKKSADYVGFHSVQPCKTCTMFRYSSSEDKYDHCTVVAGAISPMGHCKYYERKGGS